MQIRSRLETSTLKLIVYPLNIPMPNHPNPNHCHNRYHHHYHYDHHHHHCKKQSCPRWNWSGVRKRPLTSCPPIYIFWDTRFPPFSHGQNTFFGTDVFLPFFGNIFHVRCPGYWELIVMLTIVNYFLILKEREKYHQRWMHCLHSIKKRDGWLDGYARLWVLEHLRC